jgi:tRNA nucleotidyltransferase/poly(A) polymerase
MKINLPNEVQNIIEVFRKHKFDIYLVGGTVRGLIMNRKISDWDFTTNATPDQIMKLFPHSYYENNYGTVSVPSILNEDNTIFEITTFRYESKYTNLRHPDEVVWAKDINEDLARRDFTINAIAYNGNDFIDPFFGIEDIKSGIIKSVGDSQLRFREDALRLFRAIRQATQLNFQIDKETRESIIKNADLISNISGERVRDELFKLLESDNASNGILLLKEVGLLKYIIPELEKCFLIDQKSPFRHHIYDVGVHSVNSLKNCRSKNVITRLATLLHDIGKVDTYHKNKETGIVTFYNHEVVGEELTSHIADRLKLSKEQKKMLCILVRNHQFTVTEEQSDKSLRRFLRIVGLELIDEMLELRRADRIGSGAKETSWRTELFKKRLIEVQKIPFSIKDLKISGQDVMEILQIPPSPKVGEVLNIIFSEVDDEKLVNDRELLIKRVHELKP